MESYDVAVLGGGPGGYAAAIRASQMGLKTALIEKEHLGGVCLNWGCIPTKSLLKNAEVISLLNQGETYGFRLDGPSVVIDYAAAQARSRAVSKKLVSGLDFLMKKNNITVFKEQGTLTPSRHIMLASGREIAAKSVILAMGARSKRIGAWGTDERILYSKDILSMTKLPASIIIIGAGAIGVEFAGIMNAYGVEVAIVEALPAIVPNEDHEVSAELEKHFRKRGVKILTQTMVRDVAVKDGMVSVTVAKDGAAQTLTAERILVSVGVTPNTEAVGLEAAGIKLNGQGFVEVDARMRTNQAGVYAIGDVTGKLPLAHTASAQALTAVADICAEETDEINYANIPRCTYCSLETASVGLTERDAQKKGYAVKIGKFPFSANGKALSLNESEGFVKVVSDGKNGELLGMHMIGPHVTELIAGAAGLIGLEATADEVAKIVHPHPTLSEAVAEACHAVYGRAIHI